MSNDEIKKISKKMSTHFNFSNSWSGSLDQKHPILKNHDVWFLTNQILKDEIIKKINYIKESKIENSN
jgi:hypothetical protein